MVEGGRPDVVKVAKEGEDTATLLVVPYLGRSRSSSRHNCKEKKYI